MTVKNCFVLFYFIEIIEVFALFKSHAYVSEPPQKKIEGLGTKSEENLALEVKDDLVALSMLLLYVIQA